MPPAARMNDIIQAVDIHIINIPTPAGPVPTPLPHPYVAPITINCATNVIIGGQPAATLGSQSTFVHIPQGGPFAVPPTGTGQIMAGSATVMIGGKPAARITDMVITCMDSGWVGKPMIIPTGSPTVMIGG